jgi:hypothetical protein
MIRISIKELLDLAHHMNKDERYDLAKELMMDHTRILYGYDLKPVGEEE